MATRVWCRPHATEVTWSGFSTYDQNSVKNQSNEVRVCLRLLKTFDINDHLDTAGFDHIAVVPQTQLPPLIAAESE